MNPWVLGLRRATVPLVLGVVCWVLSWWAIEDLHPLLVGLGAILVALGGVVVVATARTSSSLAGRPANLSPDGRD